MPAVDRNQFSMHQAIQVISSAARQRRAASEAETLVDAHTELAISTAPPTHTTAAKVVAERKIFSESNERKMRRGDTPDCGMLNSSRRAVTVAARPSSATKIHAMVIAIVSMTAVSINLTPLP